MANVVWRRDSQKVYVYYYDKATGKLRQVPRDVTREWDGLPKEEVYAKVRQWEMDNGLGVDRAQRMVLKDADKLMVYWDAYQKNRMRVKGRREKTEKNEKRHFETYIVPFFVGQHQKKNPTHWHSLVPEFHTWLFAKDLKDDTVSKILWALERFGEYLVFARHMSFPFTVQTPSAQNHKVTPLKKRIPLDDALKLLKASIPDHPPRDESLNAVNFKLGFLLAYFGSLRPQEVYALDKEDFITGDAAVTESKTYSGFREKGLGSRLSIPIVKTINDSKVVPLTKTHYSVGLVNIWHPEAARAIAAIVKTMKPGRLFPYTRGTLDRLWRQNAAKIYGGTFHDMRRASGLYLGRTVRVELTLLQDHMRHAEIDTTLLYCRDPDVPEKETVATQNFDDVG